MPLLWSGLGVDLWWGSDMWCDQCEPVMQSVLCTEGLACPVSGCGPVWPGIIFALFILVVPFMVSQMSKYCYGEEDPADIPRRRYVIHVLPAGQYVDGPCDRTGGFSHDTVSHPGNPWWVRYYHERE